MENEQGGHQTLARGRDTPSAGARGLGDQAVNVESLEQSASATFRWPDRTLRVPYVRWEDGAWKTRWRTPTHHAFLQILKHPIYAGAYA